MALACLLLRPVAGQASTVSGVNEASYDLTTPTGQQQLATMQVAGVRVVRTDASWGTVQPSPPTASGPGYDFSQFDTLVSELAAHNMTWFPIIDYSTPWAASIAGNPFSAPASDTAYAAYAQALAARYGDGGSFWTENPQLPYDPVQVLSGVTLTPGGRPALGSPWSPFEPAGAPGPGFGVPATAGAVVPGLLPSLYGGTMTVGNPWNSPIPGYGYYEDATTPEAVPDGDITNAALFAASFFVAGPLGDLGTGLLRTLGEAAGIGGAGSAAITGAGESAYAERVLGALESGAARSTSLGAIMRSGVTDRAVAEIETEINQATVRAKAIETLVNAASSKLPTGVPAIITEIANRGWAYASWSTGQLFSAQSALFKIGTPTALAAAHVIGVILKAVG